MRNVNINKQELLDILRSNKEKHVSDYKEGVQDYFSAVLKLVERNLELARSGDLSTVAKISPMPPAPTSYESAYNRASRMLELSVDDVIELDEQTFNQLVLDEWAWKSMFAGTTQSYKGLLA